MRKKKKDEKKRSCTKGRVSDKGGEETEEGSGFRGGKELEMSRGSESEEFAKVVFKGDDKTKRSEGDEESLHHQRQKTVGCWWLTSLRLEPTNR